tara:strand:+ start:1549 stop:1767 length:219 start_codon:yes stop_codon:yes gene_type:complete
MNGYKFNTLAEVNNAIQQVNTNNSFVPIQGNVTQTLISAMQGTYQGNDFYYLLEDEYSVVLGVSEEILIDEE